MVGYDSWGDGVGMGLRGGGGLVVIYWQWLLIIIGTCNHKVEGRVKIPSVFIFIILS